MWWGKRRRLVLVMHSDGVSLHRAGVAALRVTIDGTAAASALEQIAGQLSPQHLEGARELVVLVSGRWIGLASVPWSEAMLTQDGALRHARAVLHARGHELQPDGVVHLDARPAHRRPRAAMAVPAWLQSGLTALARRAALRLVAVQPLSLIAASWLAARSDVRSSVIAVIDGDTLVLVGRAAVAPDPWHELVDAQLPDDPLGRAEVLWQRARIRLPALDHVGSLPLTSLNAPLPVSPPDAALASTSLPADWPSVLAARAAAAAAVDAVPAPRGKAWIWPGAAAACLAGTGFLAAQAWQWQNEARRLAVSAAHGAAPRSAPPPGRELLAEIRAVNAAVAQINLPLDAILRALQPPRDLPVFVLSLDIDGYPAAPVKLTAESRSGLDMTRYVAFLGDRPNMASARLVRHEIDAARPAQPYRFVVELAWRP